MIRSLVGAILSVFLASSAISAAAAPPFLLMWGTRGGEAGQFGSTGGPRAADVDQYGNVYVVDKPDGGATRVQVFDAEGRYSRQFPVAFDIGTTVDIALDADGNIFLVNSICSRVEKYDNLGGFLRMWGKGVNGGAGFEVCLSGCVCGSMGAVNGELNRPTALGVDADGNVYVADTKNERIVKYSGQGVFDRTWGWDVAPGGGAGYEVCLSGCGVGLQGNGDGQFDDPVGIAVLENTVYVADHYNYRVQLFSRTGSFQAAHMVNYPLGSVDVDRQGGFYFTVYTHDKVGHYDSSGVLIATWGSTGRGIGEFYAPSEVAVAPNGDVYIVDSLNYRLQKFGSPLMSFKAEPPDID